jgi:hypothetical protein
MALFDHTFVRLLTGASKFVSESGRKLKNFFSKTLIFFSKGTEIFKKGVSQKKKKVFGSLRDNI